jgi:Flp pilus assembly protein TadG
VTRPSRRPSERGSAVVDFVLVMVILIPLFLGIMQVALVLYVRNTLTAAASEGARYGATIDHIPANGAARTQQQIAGTLTGKYAGNVSPGIDEIEGAEVVVITVDADVPALGLFGPSVHLTVKGHAIKEVP